MQENDSRNTLEYAKWLLIAGGLVILFSPCLLTMPALIKGFDFTETGPIGDTIGGITAPFVNLVGAGLVFLALRAQVQANGLVQSQIDDQREQHYLDIVNESIRTQVSRIDESIRALNFSFNNRTEKVSGYEGIYEFNEAMNRMRSTLGWTLSDTSNDMRVLFFENIRSLTELYDRVSAAVILVDKLIVSYSFDQKKQHELRRILLLNIGDNFRVNLNSVLDYIKWHEEKADQLDVIYPSAGQISRLKQLVNIVRDFYDNTHSSET